MIKSCWSVESGFPENVGFPPGVLTASMLAGICTPQGGCACETFRYKMLASGLPGTTRIPWDAQANPWHG